MSPVPPPTSTIRISGRGASQSIIAAFHRRCRPPTHEIVHQIVPRGDTVEHAGHQRRLGVSRDGLETEMSGAFIP